MITYQEIVDPATRVAALKRLQEQTKEALRVVDERREALREAEDKLRECVMLRTTFEHLARELERVGVA